MRVIAALIIVFLCEVPLWGQLVTDTVWSTARDRLIITYEIETSDDDVRIVFRGCQKKLGDKHSREFPKLSCVFALFFDRLGRYGDVSFSGLVPEAFMVPSSVNYKQSVAGFYPLHDEPVLTFKWRNRSQVQLDIPLYLAYYEGKQKYKLFAECKDLRVRISPQRTMIDRAGAQAVSPRTVITSVETDEGNEMVTEALSCIATVSALLEVQDQLPFSEGLQYEITRLRLMQHSVDNEDVQAKIREILTQSEMKKSQLQSLASAAAVQAQHEADLQASRAEAAVRARQDSLETVSHQNAKEQEKRNIWLIASGVGAVILCFAGNQVFQHVRNVRNQRNMMEMSQSLARQAESDAMRRARSYARCKARQTVNKTIQKGKQATSQKVKLRGKKGNFSI